MPSESRISADEINDARASLKWLVQEIKRLESEVERLKAENAELRKIIENRDDTAYEKGEYDE
jgi:predicted RNase H-like nuclease (RuvC/YqgF family)